MTIGIGVEVYGSVGSIDVYGRPVSTYELDGFASTDETYQAEIIEPGFFTSHTLFYRSPMLLPGNHQHERHGTYRLLVRLHTIHALRQLGDFRLCRTFDLSQ